MKEQKLRPYGLRAGKLMQFGNMWLNLDEVAAIDMENPERDGRCKIVLRGGAVVRPSSEDTGCLLVWLEDMELIHKAAENAAAENARFRRHGEE